VGLGVVERLLELGYNVSIVDFNAQAGTEVTKRLGSKTLFTKANVINYEEQASAFAATFAKWGRIDFFYANAGIGDRIDFTAPAKEFLSNGAPVKPDTLVVDICLNGCIWSAYPALHYFRSNPDGVGKIAMTSSMCGIYVGESIPLYTAAKHGVVGLTRAMGRKLKAAGVPVTVNCVCPGLVPTPLVGTMPQVCPPDFITPISTVVKAIEGFLSDSSVTGQAAECSGENIYYRPMHEYSDKGMHYAASTREGRANIWQRRSSSCPGRMRELRGG
jgi:15-hydroxyprostaglandin dehydrogenase (NAD)